MLFLALTLHLPDPKLLKNYLPTISHYMREDAHWDQIPIPRLKSFPVTLANAVLVAEDDHFFTHKGFDWQAIKKAVKTNWQAKTYKHGASTISQQLVRNLFLSAHKSLVRKGYEAYLTWQLEKHLTKKQILTLYLQLVEFAPSIYGAQNGAWHYFKIPPHQISSAQASQLAAVLPKPKKWGQNLKYTIVQKRAHLILNRMNQYGDFFTTKPMPKTSSKKSTKVLPPKTDIPMPPPVITESLDEVFFLDDDEI